VCEGNKVCEKQGVGKARREKNNCERNKVCEKQGMRQIRRERNKACEKQGVPTDIEGIQQRSFIFQAME